MSGCERKPDRAQPSRDATTHIILMPLAMLEKLSALIPAPRAHLVRYAGSFAPAAEWRALIVPAVSVEIPFIKIVPCSAESLVTGAAAETSSIEPSVARHGRNYTWAELMKRVWALDVLECPRCQGRMQILAAIHSPDAIGKILDCLGLLSRAPPATPEFPLPVHPF